MPAAVSRCGVDRRVGGPIGGLLAGARFCVVPAPITPPGCGHRHGRTTPHPAQRGLAHDDPLDWLQQLNNLPGIAEVYVDTAGWFDLDPDTSGDGLGDGYSADALRTVLDVTSEAIVPVLPAPMCFDPTARTIRKLLEPRNIPYRVFINDWDPRDGEHWLEQTQKFIRGQGWPLAETVVRHYKIHTNASNEGVVVTQYKKTGSAANAASDFYKLADELNTVGVR